MISALIQAFQTASEKQRQWLWFAGLIIGGMAGMLVLAGVVRMMISIGG